MTTNLHLISDTTPATPSTVAGDTVVGVSDYASVRIVATLQGATGGTLDIFLQGFDGTNWFDVVHFPQLAAAAGQATQATSLSRTGELGGAALQTIGLDLVPLLAANQVVSGEFSDRLRAVYVAGGGTTVGAAQTIRIIGTYPAAGSR